MGNDEVQHALLFLRHQSSGVGLAYSLAFPRTTQSSKVQYPAGRFFAFCWARASPVVSVITAKVVLNRILTEHIHPPVIPMLISEWGESASQPAAPHRFELSREYPTAVSTGVFASAAASEHGAFFVALADTG